MKKLFAWLKAHKPTKRKLIQLYAALLFNANLKGYVSGTIFTGLSKVLCVPGMNCYSCPGAIGACPLGSLQAALSSDRSALYYVGSILALYGLIFGRWICGWLCPFGFIQEILYAIKTPKIKKSKVTGVLSYLKYVFLFVVVFGITIGFASLGMAVPAFCKYFCPVGTLEGSYAILFNPSNESLLATVGSLFSWKTALTILVVGFAIFMYRPFCRFICPLGALYGFFAPLSLIGVKVEQSKCVNCGACLRACKMDIAKVGDHECIACGECIGACPTKAISWKGNQFFLHKNDLSTPAPDTHVDLKEAEKKGGSHE